VRTTDEALLTVQEMIDRYDAMTPEEQRTIEALYRGERPVHAPEPTVPRPDNAADRLRIENNVYDCLYEQDPMDIDVAKFLAALDRAGLEVREKGNG
jgi:hypothetical protein